MNNRIEQIKSNMVSFNKELYAREEVLGELFKLQDEVVSATFNEEHSRNANLRFVDAGNYLEMLNAECGHVADEALGKFKEEIDEVTNMIRAIISGQKGEHKAYKSLETLRSKNTILRNVEFSSGDHRTELDLIVITHRAVFIVEVKNTSKNIHIDERGNYSRVLNTGLVPDCNIAEKMNDKEYLLREAFKKAGLDDVNIVSFVVFTNSLMKVENNFPYITTCYLSDLPHRIDRYESDTHYSYEQVDNMAKAINESEYHGEYPINFDVEAFKNDFAFLLATLEYSKKHKDEKALKRLDFKKLFSFLKKGAVSSVDWAKNNQEAIFNLATVSLATYGTISKALALKEQK